MHLSRSLPAHRVVPPVGVVLLFLALVIPGGTLAKTVKLPKLDGKSDSEKVTLLMREFVNTNNAFYAAQAVAKLGEPAFEPLLDGARDGDPRNRAMSAYALGEMGDRRAVSALTNLVTDPYASVRGNTAVALGLLGKVEGVDSGGALLPLLGDTNRVVRACAVVAVGKLRHASAVPALIRIATEAKTYDQSWAVASLGQIGTPQAIEWLVQYSGAIPRGGELAVVYGLRESADPRARQVLLSFLQSPDPTLRRETAWTLGGLREPAALEPLTGMLQHSAAEVRLIAALSLGRLGDARAVPPLIAMLEGRDASGRPFEKPKTTDPRRGAMWALGELRDPRAVQPLLDHVTDYYDWRWASSTRASGWGLAPGPEFIAGTSDQPDDPGVQVHLNALWHSTLFGRETVDDLVGNHQTTPAWALGKIGAPARDPLIAALSDKQEVVRENASFALGVIGDAKAVPPLITALKDRKPNVRFNAAGALAKIPDAQARQVLDDALVQRDWETVAAASSYYVRKGDPASVKTLTGALHRKGRLETVLLFLNSGHDGLEHEAREWCRLRGHVVRPPEPGIPPVRWGEGLR